MESKKNSNYSAHELIGIQDEFSKDHIESLEKALKEKRKNSTSQNSQENNR